MLTKSFFRAFFLFGLFSSLLLLVSCSATREYDETSKTISSLDNRAVKVVLLAGQSNMSGIGDFDKLSEHDKQRVHAAAKRVNISVMGRKPQALSYKKAHHSQVEKYGLTKTFGPELFIGVMLAEQFPEDEFLLIKNSQGGTSLYGAWSANWSAEKAKRVENKAHKQSHSFHQAHLSSIHANLTQLSQRGEHYQVMGMAWMQGENDAAKEVSATSYQANLVELIASYRQSLSLPNMPFVIGQINSNYGRFKAGPEMVRAAQKAVADSDNNAALVATKAKAPWSDYPKHFGVHYNGEGQKRLGIAFYQQLMGLIEVKLNKAQAF